MICWRIRKHLPGFLDGVLPGDAQRAVRQHLEYCDDCRGELERYRKLSLLLSRVERAAPPAELAARIRASAAGARNQEGWVQRLWGRTALIFENILEPLAVPATGGVLATVLVFFLTYHSLLVGVPLGPVENDLPIGLTQPARLESLAPFPVPSVAEGPVPSPAENHSPNGGILLLVEAKVNAQGEVVDYQILSGPDGLAVRRQLDQVLLFSRFRPRMNFGRPTAGGRVMLSFSEIRVKG